MKQIESTVTVKVSEGEFLFRGSRDDGSSKWEWRPNPGGPSKPPRQYMKWLARDSK